MPGIISCPFAICFFWGYTLLARNNTSDIGLVIIQIVIFIYHAIATIRQGYSITLCICVRYFCYTALVISFYVFFSRVCFSQHISLIIILALYSGIPFRPFAECPVFIMVTY